ncbi:MAG: hypothetical protein JSV88_31330 [Candidatus Aminicenantes bacterium]|nr:MAG: hypothetical protein JSV88_31330 [Candidatus Aminicenantes bacterium]
MILRDISKLSLKELAAYISHYLRRNGVPNVLTGGACVCIYTENRYQSFDLDFVNIEGVPISRVSSLLKEIGFEEKGRIFINDKVKYSVDILNPPLSVGRQHIVTVNTIEVNKMILKLLTPTDSVKDRLAAFYFWNDRQAFEQAKLIQAYNEVDFDEIRKWSEMEGQVEKFNYFIEKTKREIKR